MLRCSLVVLVQTKSISCPGRVIGPSPSPSFTYTGCLKSLHTPNTCTNCHVLRGKCRKLEQNASWNHVFREFLDWKSHSSDLSPSAPISNFHRAYLISKVTPPRRAETWWWWRCWWWWLWWWWWWWWRWWVGDDERGTTDEFSFLSFQEPEKFEKKKVVTVSPQ